jgi:hypothetical protein
MTRIRTIPEITEAGTRALVRALGYPDAVRFITALRPGSGDYTKDRRKLLKDVTAADVLAQVREIQKRDRAAGRATARRKRSA